MNRCWNNDKLVKWHKIGEFLEFCYRPLVRTTLPHEFSAGVGARNEISRKLCLQTISIPSNTCVSVPRQFFGTTITQYTESIVSLFACTHHPMFEKVPQLRYFIAQEGRKTSCHRDRTKTTTTHGDNRGVRCQEQIDQSRSSQKEKGEGEEGRNGWHVMRSKNGRERRARLRYNYLFSVRFKGSIG